jgi:flagellar biosynthetic protein FliR
MMGLAISKMLDPVSGTQQTLLGQLFMILGSLIMLSLDIHHIFLNVLAESFSVLPIGTYHLPHEALHTLSHGTMRIFDYAVKLSAIPFTILTLVTIGLGFMAKIMPEMNIFMVGFPLKIFIGYYTLIMAVSLFPLILKQGFYEFENMAKILISQIAGGP